MPAKKSTGLSDLLASAVAEARGDARRKTWFDRLPDELRDDLLEARRGWKAGEGHYVGLSSYAMARSVCKALMKSGRPSPRPEAIRTWLLD
jgi:hypothetical protein